MKKLTTLIVATLTVGTLATVAHAETKFVGGAMMYDTKTIVENASKSRVHTTLVAAVGAAGLVDTLSGPGPFTVFAPTNDAFAALPEGTVETLLKPENKHQLVKILTAHVVAGDISYDALEEAIETAGGTYAFKTVSGDTLRAVVRGDRIYIADENGDLARITASDVNQSNGVIHVINKVLLPR